MLAQQPRRAFHQLCNLTDKDSSELWNSSHMECRPFKDPTYDLRRLEQDIAIQAVPLTEDLAIQATPARVRPCAVLTSLSSCLLSIRLSDCAPHCSAELHNSMVSGKPDAIHRCLLQVNWHVTRNLELVQAWA